MFVVQRQKQLLDDVAKTIFFQQYFQGFQMKQTSRLIVLFSVFGAVVLTGCSRKIEGEAYYKNGDSVVKMAGAEIRVMELDKFQAHVSKKMASVAEEEKRILGYISSATESVAKLKASRDAVMKAQMDMMMLQAKTGAAWNMNSLEGQYRQGQQDKVMSAGDAGMKSSDTAIQDNEQRVAAYKTEIETLKSGRSGKFLFPREKNDDFAVVNTNSDGKYEMTLKSDKDLVFLVNKDAKYWIIKLGKDDKSLSFTDLNENSNSCDVCVTK